MTMFCHRLFVSLNKRYVLPHHAYFYKTCYFTQVIVIGYYLIVYLFTFRHEMVIIQCLCLWHRAHEMRLLLQLAFLFTIQYHDGQRLFLVMYLDISLILLCSSCFISFSGQMNEDSHLTFLAKVYMIKVLLVTNTCYCYMLIYFCWYFANITI